MYTFPFEVPADLTALSGEEFSAFAETVRTHAQTTLGDEQASPEALIATRELFATVVADEERRTALEADATAARAELAAGLAPVVAPATTEPVPAPAPEPEPVPAATPPAPAVTAGTGSTLDPAPVAERPRVGVLIASADAPGVRGELTDFAAVGRLLDTQFGRYSRSNSGGPARPLGGNKFAVGGRSMVRHSIAAIQREYPAELRIRDGNDARRVLDYARNERRLPGGSLARSAQARVDAGAALTAAAGWCAPSEILYDLCSLSSMDGMLDIPTIQASRGGFQIPEDGGPNFATIYDLIGDDGDVILTEAAIREWASGFSRVEIEPYSLLLMAKRAFRRRYRLLSALHTLDEELLRLVPGLRRYCGECVIVLRR